MHQWWPVPAHRAADRIQTSPFPAGSTASFFSWCASQIRVPSIVPTTSRKRSKIWMHTLFRQECCNTPKINRYKTGIMAIILPHIGLIIKCQGEIFILKIPRSAGYSANELLPEKPGCRSRMLSLTELIMIAKKCIIEKIRKGGTCDGHIDRAV